MKKLANRGRFCVLLSLMLLFDMAVLSQEPAKSPLPFQGTGNIPAPNPRGSNPKPGDAKGTILAAFDSYEVVGMSAAHGNKDLDDFILHLIRDPSFPSKVNVIAVECGNALYQPTLDRYIAGADVPLSEVRKTWRNTTQTMCGMSGFYEEFFPLVRRINQTLPTEKKLRVLACDPPIDWSKIKDPADYGRGQYLMRDVSIASVMEKEVLSKHRKALMLFGTAHLFHVGNTGVGLYEKDYPGLTLVIADHTGFGNWSPLEKYNNEFEARMALWPIPSLVQDIHGTWLAALMDMTHATGNIFFGVANSGKLPLGPAPAKGTFSGTPEEAEAPFSKMVDAYLYLGPRDLLLNEPTPAEIALDKDYMIELQRRSAIFGAGPMADDADPGKISERDSNPFFYDPDELGNLPMQLPEAPSSPLAKN
ncbi:hypothetical protein [Granulicella arctica]|uniref:Uncharacterized protein n=1 Tax=Granulicella arctica TaxID=940613 RepID=A0A7Y9PHU1_9BACT|nr:hypothetical protein [Granulicella arctica]NYF80168.1 hypothetical protein [Granulicella arctica]